MIGKGLRLASWALGILLLLASLGFLTRGEVATGVLGLLLSLYLLPPVRTWVHERIGWSGSRTSRSVIAVALFILFIIPMSASISEQKEEEARIAAAEQARLDSIKQAEQDSIADYETTRAAFLVRYPHIEEEWYDEWAGTASDSSVNPELRTESFVVAMKNRADSIAAKKRNDSVEYAQMQREYEAKKAEEARREAAAEQAAIREREARCTWRGHRLHQGPRGGCYYLVGDRKEYVQDVSCAGC